jgi:cytochrome c5
MAGTIQMKTLCIALLGILLLACSLKLSAGPQFKAAAQKTPEALENKEGPTGEQRFKENCGRCHNRPEAISPREVKAVLQHMRARATLSADDERLILKFLAP